MSLISPGADVVPEKEPQNQINKRFRLITVGKKQLPDPLGSGRGGRRQTFWATVVTVADDLHKLEKGLGEQTYETKTRGQCLHCMRYNAKLFLQVQDTTSQLG